MASIRAINVPGLGQVGLGDWIDDQLWATVQVDNGQTAELQAFTAGRGQQKPGTSNTNSEFDVYVPEPGRMPQGYEMLVFSVGIKVAGTATAADMQNLKDTLLGEFWILGKVYTQGHFDMFPYGGGISGESTENDVKHWNNGVPAAAAARQYLVPHKIGEGEAFYFKIRFPGSTAPTLTASLDVAVILRGLLKRTVQ